MRCRRRRIAAYGVCRDDDGRVLLARGSAPAGSPALWPLPGGGVEHGEHPDDAVVREFAEETGLAVAVDGPARRRSPTCPAARTGDVGAHRPDGLRRDAVARR